MNTLCARLALATALTASLCGRPEAVSAAPLVPARPTPAQAAPPLAYVADMPAIFEVSDPNRPAVAARARVPAKPSRTAEAAPKPGPNMRPLRVMATAYALRGRTAGGTLTRMGTIAVDPRLIPLGTRLYVPGYGWGKALDTGGAIRGNVIDLWMPSNRACFAWGVRSVNIMVEVPDRHAVASKRPTTLASRGGRPRKPKPHAAAAPAGSASTATPAAAPAKSSSGAGAGASKAPSHSTPAGHTSTP